MLVIPRDGSRGGQRGLESKGCSPVTHVIAKAHSSNMRLILHLVHYLAGVWMF